MSRFWHRRMSYHAPHTMNVADIAPDKSKTAKQEDGQDQGVLPALRQEDGQDQGVLPALRQEDGQDQGVLPAPRHTVCVVYDYDHQTTQYSCPLLAYTTRAAALAHRGELGWVGVHKLDVWHSVEDWKAAGKPIYEN
jgi:hypothetical protein